MSYDPIGALRAAGHSVDMLSSAQRQVLAELDRAEIDFLIRLRYRLEEVAPEVQGQDLKLL